MKKLMFAALAVAGMTAFADTNETFVAAEKIQLTLKTVDKEKLNSVKLNGLVFIKEDLSVKVVTWGKETIAKADEHKCKDGKVIKNKKFYVPVNLGAYDAKFYMEGQKKQGKAISFGKDYIGYGSGSIVGTASTDDKVARNYTKESVSGNIVNQATRQYGTWKMSLDKSTGKLLKEKKYSMEDVLAKNKVEYWDL